MGGDARLVTGCRLRVTVWPISPLSTHSTSRRVSKLLLLQPCVQHAHCILSIRPLAVTETPVVLAPLSTVERTSLAGCNATFKTKSSADCFTLNKEADHQLDGGPCLDDWDVIFQCTTVTPQDTVAGPYPMDGRLCYV